MISISDVASSRNFTRPSADGSFTLERAVTDRQTHILILPLVEKPIDDRRTYPLIEMRGGIQKENDKMKKRRKKRKRKQERQMDKKRRGRRTRTRPKGRPTMHLLWLKA